jgi:hypothetical protein
MKKLIAVITLVLSFSAFAEKKTVSFTYSGIESYGRSYYACDYVEYQTEKMLELFGATQIDVSCSGGIQFGSMWPVSIRATFEAPTLVGNEVAEVKKIEGDFSRPACGLNTTIVKRLLPSFSNVKVVKKSDSCAFASSNYSYTFEIIK